MVSHHLLVPHTNSLPPQDGGSRRLKQVNENGEATVEQHEGGVSQEAVDSFEVFNDNHDSIYGIDGGATEFLDYGFYDYDLYEPADEFIEVPIGVAPLLAYALPVK